MSASPLWDQINALFPELPDAVREFTLNMRVGEVPTITVEFYMLDQVTDDGEVPSVTRSFRIEEAETDEQPMADATSEPGWCESCGFIVVSSPDLICDICRNGGSR